MTHNYTYDQMFRVADKLWPGEAEDILFDPTDTQLDLILAVLRSSPVEDGITASGRVANSDNNFTNLPVKFRIAVRT